MLTAALLKDPVVSKSLQALSVARPFSASFDNLKERLKDYIMKKTKVDPAVWGNDWAVEESIMTYLFGEGHA